HQSDTQVITVKMEILLEPTSNKLMVERFDTSAGNLVKEILLKLIPDNSVDLTIRRILKDGGEGTDIAKITRKEPKTGQKRTRETQDGKSPQERNLSSNASTKSPNVQPWS
ncbi:hypothetical protein Tco_0942181, partial [Tanacetum coccineum]